VDFLRAIPREDAIDHFVDYVRFTPAEAAALTEPGEEADEWPSRSRLGRAWDSLRATLWLAGWRITHPREP
jgi:hypothetical protein